MSIPSAIVRVCLGLLVLLPSLVQAQSIAAPEVMIPPGPHGPTENDPLNQDKAKFSVSTLPTDLGRAFFYSSQNNRIMLNFQTGSTWRFPTTSIVPIEMDESMLQSTIAVGTVFRRNEATFRNPQDDALYEWLMYFIYQPSDVPPPVDPSAGFLCVAFSHNGTSWLPPYTRASATSSPLLECDSPDRSTTRLESLAGSFIDSMFLLAGLEGDIGMLQTFARSGLSLTYLYSSTASAPHLLHSIGELPITGVVAPTYPDGDLEWYFLNLDLTYDPMSDRVLLARAMPFPYDLDGAVPCDLDNVCLDGLATYPMRSQVYSKVLAGDPHQLLQGEWRLEADIGGPTGWSAIGSNGCEPFPASEPFQTNIDVDTDSINFFKDGNGLIMREADGRGTLYLGGYDDRRFSCNSWPTAFDTFLDGKLYSYFLDLPIFSDGFETETLARWSAACPEICTRGSSLPALAP